MNRIFSLIAGLCMTASVAATPSGDGNGKKFMESDLSPLTPTYLDNVYQGSEWDSNWFVSVKGGFSSFNGKPVGCGDFFDRSKMMLNIGVGKWFTPKVGGRIVFQGFTLTDSQKRDCDFQSVHADFLYNLLPLLSSSKEMTYRWGVIPYLGCGIIHNGYNGNKPFGISFGVIGQYAVNGRLSVGAEIGNTATLADFDGIGDGSKMKDNLFHASVGLTVNIGKTGWKRVIDAKPYIYQNDILLKRLNELYANGGNIRDTECEEDNTKDKNNYSGLNSLRMRMKMANADLARITDNNGGAYTNALDSASYLAYIKDGNLIGAPILFFFHLNSTKLVDPSQIINLDMIAKVVKKHNLKVKVIGAADSKTGRKKGNMKLSQTRSSYLGKLLQHKGVPEADIEMVGRGGIDKYDPYWSNRHSCIMLFMK